MALTNLFGMAQNAHDLEYQRQMMMNQYAREQFDMVNIDERMMQQRSKKAPAPYAETKSNKKLLLLP